MGRQTEDLSVQVDGIQSTFTTAFQRTIGTTVVFHQGVKVDEDQFTEPSSKQITLGFVPAASEELFVVYFTDETVDGRVRGFPDDPTAIPPPAFPQGLQEILEDQSARIDAVEAAVEQPPDPKDSAQVATIGDLSATYDDTGGTGGNGSFTAAPLVVDGVTVLAGFRVLVRDQANSDENGIYVVLTPGTGTDGVWERAPDFVTGAGTQVTEGARAHVTRGTQRGRVFLLTTPDPIAVGGPSGSALAWIAGTVGAFANGTGANSVFGPGAVDPTAVDSFASGSGSRVTGDQGFAAGLDMESGPSSFSHGYGYGSFLGATGFASFAQGAAVRVDGNYSFGQGGFFVDLRGNQNFGQGTGIFQITNAQNILLQGQQINVVGASPQSIFQGRNITFSVNSVGSNQAFGNSITFTTAAEATFAAGDGLTFDGASKSAVFAQGQEIFLTGLFSDIFVQGSEVSLVVSKCVTTFCQGYEHTFTGDIEAVLVQGRGHTFSNVKDGFAQGRKHTLSGQRISAFGNGVKVVRDDQHTIGSNRVSSGLGLAQASQIVKHVQTTDATQTTLVTLDLEEDKSYSLVVNVVARNTDTDDEVASFVVSQAIAYRDTGGAAVLVGSPVSLTRLDSGGGAAAWSADLAQSGNNVLLRVIGDLTDTVEWCVRLGFVEVKG